MPRFAAALAASPGRRGAGVVTPALEIDGLAKRFGGIAAARDVSMRLMPGERRLLIGPNGAGKTTLFNLITGDLRADKGSIRLFGRELAGMPTRRRARSGLARTYQILTLFPRETLAHNVVLALLGPAGRDGGFGARSANGRRCAMPRTRHLRVWASAGSRDRRVAQTSYGEQRRLEIAMALAQ